MGAAWSNPKQRDMPFLMEMVKGVKEMGLETCMTLGKLDAGQAQELKQAGLDYYNHNLDTSPEFYGEIITTRTYQDRLDTLQHVRDAGMKVCCGGIVGMGESANDSICTFNAAGEFAGASTKCAYQYAGESAGYADGKCRRLRWL